MSKGAERIVFHLIVSAAQCNVFLCGPWYIQTARSLADTKVALFLSTATVPFLDADVVRMYAPLTEGQKRIARKASKV